MMDDQKSTIKIQVFDARGKFAFECGDDEARVLLADGRAIKKFESAPNEAGDRVFHLSLVTKLNAPNWIFGTRYTVSERMSNGLVTHSPKRAASGLIVDAMRDVGEMVDHAYCCLALDDESKVAAMPSKKAAALLLYVIWGHTCEEVGQLLGIPKSTAFDYVEAGITSLKRRVERKLENSSEKAA